MWDLDRARLLAQAAEAAYYAPATLPGYPTVRLFQSDRADAEVIIASNDQEIIVSFRGTEGCTFSDWCTNLRGGYASPKDVPGYVHAGFLRATRQLSPIVFYTLHQDQGKPVWLTGHSMGGAMAGVFALFMARRSPERLAGVYTYGAPRFVTGKGAAWLSGATSGRYFRVQTFGDAVPHLVPYLGGWRHAGERVVLRSTVRPLKAHAISTYRGRLAAL